MYADDNQLYFPCTEINMICAIENSDDCVTSIRYRIAKNKLHMMTKKMELIQLSKNRRQNDTIL